MKGQENTQRDFFNFIIKRYSKEQVLFALMDTLYIKKGAAYKRMNGSTALLADEMVKIADYFEISIDAAIRHKQFFSFEYPFHKDKTAIDLLGRYSFFLKPLLEVEGESSLTYMANELPVFYYFSYRHIFNFLSSVWNHLHWGAGKLIIKEKQTFDPQLEQLRIGVSGYYESYPVTEIWNWNMLSNLYQQILFCVTIRAFENLDFIQNLMDDITQLLEHLYELAGKEQTSHSKSSNTKIYINEFGTYQNIALYKSEKFSSAFIGLDMPYFIVSYSAAFYEFSEQWIEKIKSHSILISSGGYQSKELFFKRMNNDFENFKAQLKRLIEVNYKE